MTIMHLRHFIFLPFILISSLIYGQNAVQNDAAESGISINSKSKVFCRLANGVSQISISKIDKMFTSTLLNRDISISVADYTMYNNTLDYTNQDQNILFNVYKNNLLIIPASRKKKLPVSIMLQAASIGTSNKTVPFWMRANQYGSIPLEGASFSLLGSIGRDYDTSNRKKLLDWGFGIEGRMNAGNKVEGILIEGYAKARVSAIEIKAGRWKEVIGIVDEKLSTGAFSISGNALGIPKIQLGLPEYWNFPFTKGLIAFKGNFAFGEIGTIPILLPRSLVDSAKTFYHQKSLYGRIGKPNWKVKFYGGVNHQVMWGNERSIYGAAFKLSTFETLQYAVIGRAYGAKGGVESSKIGNHLGSIDQGLEVNLKNVDLMGYHQFFFDVGALYYLANIKDGIWGLSIKNKNEKQSYWNKLVIEFVYSKSQAGEFDAKWTPSGDENYYNNYIYAQGWTYKGESLGNALMTQKKYARKNLPMVAREPIANDRIVAYHAAADGKIHEFKYIVKLTYTRNSGTYGTSPMGNTTGGYRTRPRPPYFPTVGQFSGYIEVDKSIFRGYHLGVAFAIDQGNMLYNSVGGLVKLSKTW